MKTKSTNIISLGIFLFVLCAHAIDSQVLDPQSIDQVELLANGKLRVLKLSGTPFERGFAHGKSLKKEIHAVIELFKTDILNTTNQDPDEFIAKFLRLTDYSAAIEKWTPDLMDELRGIAKGSEMDFATIFMHQLGDEYWFNTKDIMAHSCTSFGVNKTDKNPSMTAQNMDIPPYYHGFQTVLQIDVTDSENDVMVLTIPGHLGITGMNKNRISINCNTLMQLKYGKSGLPVTFIVRGVIAKNTQQAALHFIEGITHASGQNYIIGGPQNVYSMECSANEVHEFRPFDQSIFTYHTNHPMANQDYSEGFKYYLKKNNLSLEEGLNKCQRIGSMSSRFNEKTQSISIQNIKDALSSRDHTGPDVVSNNFTYASVIYVLTENPKFIIAPGKPHETEYIELRFE